MSVIGKRKMLWLTWEKQIRNRSMANSLNIPLFEVLSNERLFIRYVNCISRTFTLLYRERISVVICENPSIILTFFVLSLRLLFRFKVVIDAHYGGISACNGSNSLQKILDWCNKTANLVIVTNNNHALYVNSLGGRAFVCPDPLPNLSQYNKMKIEISKQILFICSYDIDEPFIEAFIAAELLTSEGFHIVASGNYQKAKISPKDFPYVKFLGFVPEDDFYRHLFSSQLVLDLTENDDCLVCGAYEAMVAGKPLVLSKKKALMDYFTSGTVFTENKAENIAKAVRTAYAKKEKLIEDSLQWVLTEKKKMKRRANELKKILDNI